jgi:hypothetical protein
VFEPCSRAADERSGGGYHFPIIHEMGSIWHWITKNWGPLGIGTCLGAVLTAASGVFKWIYPSRADLAAERQKDKDERLDERVLAALTDPSMERQSRGNTGAGFPLSRVSEIAAHIREDRNAVHESLLRLENRERVASGDGCWFPLPD